MTVAEMQERIALRSEPCCLAERHPLARDKTVGHPVRKGGEQLLYAWQHNTDVPFIPSITHKKTAVGRYPPPKDLPTMDLSTLYDPAGPVDLVENERGEQLDWLNLASELVAGGHNHLGPKADDLDIPLVEIFESAWLAKRMLHGGSDEGLDAEEFLAFDDGLSKYIVDSDDEEPTRLTKHSRRDLVTSQSSNATMD